MIDVIIGFAVGFILGGLAGVILLALAASCRDEE